MHANQNTFDQSFAKFIARGCAPDICVNSRSFVAEFSACLWFVLLSMVLGLNFQLGAVRAADPTNPPATANSKAGKSPGNVLQIDPYAGYARTKLFGLEAKGNKFVYVFDRSGSMGEMGGKPLREAKAELLASLNDLDKRQQFYIVFYNEKPRLFDVGNGRMVWATDENKKQADQFVDGITADGGTDHVSALAAALRLGPDVVFLLTDGEQQDDLSAEELKRIDRLNSGHAQINVIQFAPRPRPESTLIQLAKQSGGQHIFVDIKHYDEHGAAGQAQ